MLQPCRPWGGRRRHRGRVSCARVLRPFETHTSPAGGGQLARGWQILTALETLARGPRPQGDGHPGSVPIHMQGGRETALGPHRTLSASQAERAPGYDYCRQGRVGPRKPRGSSLETPLVRSRWVPGKLGGGSLSGRFRREAERTQEKAGQKQVSQQVSPWVRGATGSRTGAFCPHAGVLSTQTPPARRSIQQARHGRPPAARTRWGGALVLAPGGDES